MVTPLGKSVGTPLGQLVVPALLVVGGTWYAKADADFPMVPVLLGAAASCFVLALNSPVWLAVALLIPELSIFNYQVEELGLTLRLALVLAGAAVALRTILLGLRRDDPALRRLLRPAIAFVLLATAINGLFSEGDYVLKYFRYQIAQLLTMVLVACLIRTRPDLRKVVVAALGLGVLGAVASIWQHFGRETAFYGMGDPGYIAAWKSRSIGLSDNPVVLANSMLLVLVPLVGPIVVGALPRGRMRLIVPAAIGLTFVGLYFSFTRSGLIAAGGGLAAMALYLRGTRRTTLLVALAALALGFQLSLSMGLLGARYSRDTTNDRSAASHEALLTVGLAVALDNAILGVGHKRFEEVSAQYADVLEGEADSALGGIAVGNERPHNDFLSVVISWGVGGFAAYLLVLIGALRNFAIGARSQDGLIRGLAVGCAGGLAAYAVNSAFHNSLDSSSGLWLYAGLSIALARLAGRGGAREDQDRRFARRPPLARRSAARARRLQRGPSAHPTAAPA